MSIAQTSETSPLPLAGRHGAVTGGGSGIGAASARDLARLGARLTLMGRRADRLEAQARALRDECAAEIAVQPLDVTDAEAVPRAFAAAAARLGPADILINNAGAAESAPFGKTSLALFERMLRVNLTGAFLCSQAVLPAMLAAKQGRIVNVASIAGLAGYPYVAAYCAAKHGLVGLTRALAAELVKTGITVNAVCPGYTETDLVNAAVDAIVAKTRLPADEARRHLADANPSGRLVTPEEVAATIAFLCLPSSGAVNGQALVVAGGAVGS